MTGEGYALLPNVDMCNGARHSKSMERRSQRTVCLQAAYPGCALIRDLQGDHLVVNQNGSVQLGEKAAEYYL